VLRLHLDERPVSAELSEYMGELASLTDLLSVEKADTSADDASELPFVEVCRADGMPSGLEFHGVPGGHEFTSFVLGLYNVSGPGQPIDDADRAAIAAVDSDVDVRVLVGLSCTMCPEVVVAAQRIAADSPHVTARVYDINHFGDLKDRYDVMSVPCLVVRQSDGTEQVSFGKKGLSQVLEMVG
jgi:thioredoxin reductase (NADPH)